MDDDYRGPRSTEEAFAELRADTVRQLLADPHSMPQPWNETRPAGWPISEAVFVFTPESARNQVSLHLGLRAEGYGLEDILEKLAVYGWHFVRQRLSRGDLTAKGFVEGDTEPRDMHPSLFDKAEFNPLTGEVSAVGRRYGGVRIFAQIFSPMATGASVRLDHEDGKERAFLWMAANVTSYRAKQRDLRVKECRVAALVTKDEALYGWNQLDQAIKGRSRTSS